MVGRETSNQTKKTEEYIYIETMAYLLAATVSGVVTEDFAVAAGATSVSGLAVTVTMLRRRH